MQYWTRCRTSMSAHVDEVPSHTIDDSSSVDLRRLLTRTGHWRHVIVDYKLRSTVESPSPFRLNVVLSFESFSWCDIAHTLISHAALSDHREFTFAEACHGYSLRHAPKKADAFSALRFCSSSKRPSSMKSAESGLRSPSAARETAGL